MTGQGKDAHKQSLRASQKEVIISAWVFASSKREKLIQLQEDKYEVYVKEPAQNNLANKRVIKIFSELFETKNIKILTGHKSPKKKLQIKFDL